MAMAVLQVYLRVNKIWKRKHTKEVSESQSIAGNSLLLMNCLIWVVYYLQNGDTKSIVDTSIIIFEAIVFLLISTGIFVTGQPKLSFWKSFKNAFKIETQEADFLWKRMFKPDKANDILKILYLIANIDNDFDAKEKKLFEKFTKEWNIKVDFSELERELLSSSSKNIIKLKELVADYLDQSPQRLQATQLIDLIELMINADDIQTVEEKTIIEEIEPMLEKYLERTQVTEHYHVIIVPQDSDSEIIINNSMPNAIKINNSGGIAYSIGRYYSKAFAEIVCKEYRENFRMFTIVHLPETINN